MKAFFEYVKLQVRAYEMQSLDRSDTREYKLLCDKMLELFEELDDVQIIAAQNISNELWKVISANRKISFSEVTKEEIMARSIAQYV